MMSLRLRNASAVAVSPEPECDPRTFASLITVDVRGLARDERADFAAFLATLSQYHWRAPTLCAGWRVPDVVAHVISYDELDARGLLAHVATAVPA